MKRNGIHISGGMVLLAAGVLLASCSSNKVIRRGAVDGGDMMPSTQRAEVAGGNVPTYRIDVNSEMPVSEKHVEAMPTTQSVKSEREMTRMLNALFDMARNGAEVTYTADGRYSQTPPKGAETEVAVFSTPIRTAAIEWSKRMSRQGYAITVRYDKEKKWYVCKAIKVKE